MGECFARKNAEERCRGPKSWTVGSDGAITEDLKSAGADWQYYPEHPVPSDYGKCNKCKSFDPPCYSVKKMSTERNEALQQPLCSSLETLRHVFLQKASIPRNLWYPLQECRPKGEPYKDPSKETCDRNFQFTCSTW